MDTLPTLLIVENDIFAGRFISQSLRADKFNAIHVAESAPAAMKIFREHKIDCALIDIELGTGPNGVDVAHAFRKLKPKIGIVFLTSIVDPRLIDLRGLELPSSSIYLSKSLTLEIFEISNALHHSLQLPSETITKCLIRYSKQDSELTQGQFELIRLVAEGLSNKEIARKKFITIKSAENSIARLAKKLEIKDTNSNSQRVMITKRYFQMIGKI